MIKGQTIVIQRSNLVLQWARCLLYITSFGSCQGATLARWHYSEKSKISISLCLPEAIQGVYQNGCLSAADLKWGYDGDISGHVCENTITSVSRLNNSTLCDDSPPPQSTPFPSPPVLISCTCRSSLSQPVYGDALSRNGWPRSEKQPQ